MLELITMLKRIDTTTHIFQLRIENTFMNANKLTREKSSKKEITCLIRLLHFIKIDHVSRLMRIKSAVNILLCQYKQETLILTMDHTCTSSFVAFIYR